MNAKDGYKLHGKPKHQTILGAFASVAPYKRGPNGFIFPNHYITINYYFFLSQYVSQKDKILQYPADLSTTHLNSAAQRYFE